MSELPSESQLENQAAADLTADFWEERYQSGTARWDLGQPAPPFVSFMESDAAPAPGRMAVLGAGRGHDALWFAAQGFEVVGFDFAPSAIADSTAAAQRQNLKAEFLQRDIFGLPVEFANAFDYVLEHTCFCAIAPDQRPDYVRIVHQILRPQGELLALFWAHSRPGGPPYGTSLAELDQLFSTHFEILVLDPVSNSIDNRANEEYLGRLRAKP